MKIEKLRKAAHMSQAELGAKIGVSQGHIARLENDRRALTVKIAKKIAEFFGVDWWKLY